MSNAMDRNLNPDTRIPPPLCELSWCFQPAKVRGYGTLCDTHAAEFAAWVEAKEAAHAGQPATNPEETTG